MLEPSPNLGYKGMIMARYICISHRAALARRHRQFRLCLVNKSCSLNWWVAPIEEHADLREDAQRHLLRDPCPLRRHRICSLPRFFLLSVLLEVCLFLTFFLAGGIGKILIVRSLYVIGDGRCWIGRPSCELWTGCIRQRKGTSGKIWLFWFVRILNWRIGTGKLGSCFLCFYTFLMFVVLFALALSTKQDKRNSEHGWNTCRCGGCSYFICTSTYQTTRMSACQIWFAVIGYED